MVSVEVLFDENGWLCVGRQRQNRISDKILHCWILWKIVEICWKII